MIDEHDWTDGSEPLNREYGAGDITFGWLLYVVAVLFMIL